jgi:hypothetical protein
MGRACSSNRVEEELVESQREGDLWEDKNIDRWIIHLFL